ncbi:hypothetical protein [Halovivax sp.]|nr:hypothetical protein [Halovivax sp.]
MVYDLTCDTCDFDHEVDDEVGAYDGARAHEAEHPDHFVFIRTAR